jgi:excinuclease UvrABC nuclease subunit
MTPFAPENIPFLALPWKRLQDRKQMPSCAAVYFVCDATGKVLYIGQSTNLLQRWIFHNRLDQCRAVKACRIAWLEVSDPSLLPAIEEACIAYFCPPWNGIQEEGARINLKIHPDVHRVLRLIAALTRETHNAILDRLLTREWERVQVQHRSKESPDA